MSKKELFGCLGMFTGAVALSIIHVILNAWALSVLWRWFIAPFSLPTLTIAQAAGISVIFNFLIREAVNVDEDINWYKIIAKAIVPPIISVGIGWVVLQFV